MLKKVKRTMTFIILFLLCLNSYTFADDSTEKFHSQVLSGCDYASIAFNGKCYVCTDKTGCAYISKDLKKWSNIGGKLAGKTLGHIYVFNNKFLATYKNEFYTSEDGENWQVFIAEALKGYSLNFQDYNGNILDTIAYDGSKYVAIIESPRDVKKIMAYSYNLTDWTFIEKSGYNHFSSIATNGERWVALGDYIQVDENTKKNVVVVGPKEENQVYQFLAAYSTNGMDWTITSGNNTNGSSWGGLNGWNTIWNGKEFLAFNNINNSFFVSKDGDTWVEKKLSNSTNKLKSAAFGNNTYVMINDYSKNPIVLSKNLSTVENVNVQGCSNFNDIIWDGSKYIAIADGGLVATSANGSKWNILSRNSLQFTPVTGIYDGKQFILIDKDGNLKFSPDGTNWTSGSVGKNYEVLGFGMVGRKYVVGARTPFKVSSKPTAIILTSEDCKTWKKSFTCSEYISGLKCTGGKVIFDTYNPKTSMSTLYYSSNAEKWTSFYEDSVDTEHAASNGKTFLFSGSNSYSNYTVTDLESKKILIPENDIVMLGNYDFPKGSSIKTISDKSVYETFDGLSWKKLSDIPINTEESDYFNMGNYWDGHEFLIEYNNNVYISSDGSKWEQMPIVENINITGYYNTVISDGKGKSILFYSNGQEGENSNIFLLTR